MQMSEINRDLKRHVEEGRVTEPTSALVRALCAALGKKRLDVQSVSPDGDYCVVSGKGYWLAVSADSDYDNPSD